MYPVLGRNLGCRPVVVKSLHIRDLVVNLRGRGEVSRAQMQWVTYQFEE